MSAAFGHGANDGEIEVLGFVAILEPAQRADAHQDDYDGVVVGTN